MIATSRRLTLKLSIACATFAAQVAKASVSVFFLVNVKLKRLFMKYYYSLYL